MGKGVVKLGEGNWAVKDGNLLAAKETNGRFKNAEFTVTRGSDATYVGRDGLIKRFLTGNETELITNGNFSTSGDVTTSSFSLGWKISVSDNLGVSIVNNQLLLSRPVGENTDYGRAYATNGVDSINVKPANHEGRRFKLEFEIVAKTGTPTLRWYNNGYITFNDTTLGKKTIYFTSTTNRLFVFKQEHEGSSITLDNISLVDVEDVDDTPRIDFTDNTDGHLLLEPQSTNLITYSEDFEQWAEEVNIDVTNNSTTSPDGTQNAAKLQLTGSSGGTDGKISINVSPNATTHTFSVFAKKGSHNYIYIWMNMSVGLNITRWIDLNDGSVNEGSGTATVTTTSFSNDWWKIEYTFDATNLSKIKIEVADDGVSTGTGGDNIYVWGAQLEELSHPTSYIPTNGSTVTRDAETCTGAGEAIDFNSEEGVLYVEIAKVQDNPDHYRLISLNNAASNSDATSVTLGFDHNDNDFYIRIKSGGVNKLLTYTQNATTNAFHKIAIKYKSGDSAFFINGNKLTNYNAGDGTETFTFPVALDNLSFDYNGNGTLPFYGKCKAIRVYKEALNDTDLGTLTTQ